MRTRYPLAALAAVLAGSTLVLVAASSQAQPARGTIDWNPCPKAESVDCGTVTVPLDWSDPGGKTVKISLARQRATDPDSRVGSILMDPGGPGGSGVDRVKSGIPSVSDRVSKRFDIIGFDPRGVNTSTAVDCDKSLVDKVDKLPVPTDWAEFDDVARLNRKLADDCRRRTGPLFDHVDNVSVARDMDAIRAALGEKKLNYLGFSYGTLMGQQYAELFGDRIRAMVLDSNMDHSLATAWDYMDTETAAFEENFNAFADWCDDTDKCALHGRGTRVVYGQLRDKAKSGDLTDPKTGDPVDLYALSDVAFAANNPEIWAKLAKELKALRDQDKVAADKATSIKTINAPFQPMWCQDWDYRIDDFGDWQSLNAKIAKRHPNVEWSPYSRNLMTCIGYPGKTTNPQRPLDVADDTSMMLVGTRHDPITPYPWSKTAAAQSGAALVTYQGYGHAVYGFGASSDCVVKAVDDYLIRPSASGGATDCPAVSDSGDRSRTDPGAPGPFQLA